MAIVQQLAKQTGLNLPFYPSRAKIKPINHLTGKSQGRTVYIYVADYPADFSKLASWLEYLKEHGYRVIAYFTKVAGRYMIAVKRADSPCMLYIDIESKQPFISRSYRMDSEVATFLRYALYYSGYKLKYKKVSSHE